MVICRSKKIGCWWFGCKSDGTPDVSPCGRCGVQCLIRTGWAIPGITSWFHSSGFGLLIDGLNANFVGKGLNVMARLIMLVFNGAILVGVLRLEWVAG